MPDQPTDICISYLEEASAGRGVRLHVALFCIDEADTATKNGTGDEADMLPCRYASMSQTAKVLREMAHATAGGRFHWVRETGKSLIASVSESASRCSSVSMGWHRTTCLLCATYPDSLDTRTFALRIADSSTSHALHCRRAVFEPSRMLVHLCGTLCPFISRTAI